MPCAVLGMPILLVLRESTRLCKCVYSTQHRKFYLSVFLAVLVILLQKTQTDLAIALLSGIPAVVKPARLTATRENTQTDSNQHRFQGVEHLS